MAKSGITIKFSGFEELLEKYQAAGGSVDRLANSCVRESAQIVQAELKSQMQAAGVDGDLINRMPPPEIKAEGNRFSAAVGYKKGAYNPKDISDGYKVAFLNYGTPHRTEHGKIPEKGFIAQAKKKASPKVKKAQKITFEKIMGRVEKG